MLGKLTESLISFIVMTYIILFTFLIYQHENIRVAVNDINYSVSEAVSTSGVFDEVSYVYLRDSINKFGSYRIMLKLDRYIKQGIYDTYYESSTEINQAVQTRVFNGVEVLNQPLQIGDRLTIFVEDTSLTMFARFIKSTIFFWKGAADGDFRIKSVKTAVVSRRNYRLEKGYDVISEIRKYQGNPTVAVLVITKMNRNGKYYGTGPNSYITSSNPFYGDDSDEVGQTGINYIFDNGNFIKEAECSPSGEISFIKYIQQ